MLSLPLKTEKFCELTTVLYWTGSRNIFGIDLAFPKLVIVQTLNVEVGLFMSAKLSKYLL